MVCDAWGQLLAVVGHHDEGLVSSLAEEIYYLLHSSPAIKIQAVKRFVKYEEFGILYKGASQKAQSLFAR